MNPAGQSSNSFVKLFKSLHKLSTDLAAQAQLSQELEGVKDPDISAKLQERISKLTLPHVGLTEKILGSFFIEGVITDTTVYETETLSLHLFGLTRGCGFPLHDHPKMVGFTVILVGNISYRNLTVTSYEGFNILSRVIGAGELRAPGYLMLTPSHGNIHEIYATENTVLLDIFVPYYNSQRGCTFFREAALAQDYVVLRITRPPDLRARSLAYRGPRLSP
mmetsp:Transcript_21628/g.39543  ORF Transcript_21628/g.39543 Transcript_21628/m.39543 type:complete len:221 (-) Transcript_21628:89-751(-)|eukprot:CAMPEP_0204897686 /NCGR_PEP_ID=MMETSP1397-20131031/878_1 /ASSEMBLY_ACC=CAM_ASM_000891 /TAXON_ID=49980 /ORGANISM="Climacostomum Climacostomum virens, Strain Stock W-24" /LENGTH=220 /DNA_ID=CAMNT_0052065463 /DNA_START=447 /DNA_END=1109 /DNA_ORIENTATION=+